MQEDGILCMHNLSVRKEMHSFLISNIFKFTVGNAFSICLAFSIWPRIYLKKNGGNKLPRYVSEYGKIPSRIRDFFSSLVDTNARRGGTQMLRWLMRRTSTPETFSLCPISKITYQVFPVTNL